MSDIAQLPTQNTIVVSSSFFYLCGRILQLLIQLRVPYRLAKRKLSLFEKRIYPLDALRNGSICWPWGRSASCKGCPVCLCSRDQCFPDYFLVRFIKIFEPANDTDHSCIPFFTGADINGAPAFLTLDFHRNLIQGGRKCSKQDCVPLHEVKPLLSLNVLNWHLALQPSCALREQRREQEIQSQPLPLVPQLTDFQLAAIAMGARRRPVTVSTYIPLLKKINHLSSRRYNPLGVAKLL